MLIPNIAQNNTTQGLHNHSVVENNGLTHGNNIWVVLCWYYLWKVSCGTFRTFASELLFEVVLSAACVFHRNFKNTTQIFPI